MGEELTPSGTCQRRGLGNFFRTSLARHKQTCRVLDGTGDTTTSTIDHGGPQGTVPRGYSVGTPWAVSKNKNKA